VRIAIAEDHALFREGLALQLTRAGREVVVEARTGDELLALTRQHPVDVAILDVRLPPRSDEGLRVAEELIARDPGIAILLLSAYTETAYATRLFAQGTARRGYLLKERVDNAAALCDALDRICGGESVLDDTIVHRLLTRQQHLNRLQELSERERSVLQHMAEGRSNAGIARKLGLAEKTVESYVAKIFTKLGLAGAEDSNRRVLAVLAWLRSSSSDGLPPPPAASR